MPKKSPKQLYHKLFRSYSVIIICIVLALMVYFISMTKLRILETNLDYMKMMSEEAISYLKKSAEVVDNINFELYQTNAVMNDLLYYLENEDEEYQRYRLDTYMSSASLSYTGFEDFVEKTFKAYPDIVQIDFFAYDKEEVTVCYPNGKNYKSTDTGEYIKRMQTENLADYGEFSFLKEIRDPYTMQNVGCIIVTFQASRFSEIQEYYMKSEMMIVNSWGTPVFASMQKYLAEDLINADKEGNQERFLSSYVEKGTVKDYTVYVFLEKSKAGKMPITLFAAILGIGLSVILIAELLVHFYLRRLTGRLNYILDGMQQVTTGNLDIRLNADINGDELDVISENFNEMCKKLERYIQESYLAQIEQKNAEMEILQNQINPHFLYNTLEAIRMKAVCNGDREVAKMLYSMAVIYRSQLKEADIITLIQEIHYCKKYLELFEFRYQGKFLAQVECPEELMNYPIIKFILQPVLENYFIHGIRGEAVGNEIKITAEKKETILLIHIIDNGQGMSEKELKAKNIELKQNIMDKTKSIGLMNVNRRIKAVYGSEYGIELTHSEMGGMHVIIKIGMGESDGNENSHVS